MLRRINKYSHGFAFIPVGIALKKIGFYSYLSQSGPQCFSEIVNKFQANPGYLKASLDMLHVIGWLDYVDGKYFSTEKSEESKYLPVDIVGLYDFTPEELVSNDRPSKMLKKWFDPLINGWGCAEPLSDMLDGVVLIPLLLGLVRNGLVDAVNTSDVNQLSYVEELRQVFVAKKWANVKDGKFAINGVGRFMIDRCHVAGVTASYRAMLSKIPELLLGNADAIMKSEQGLEQHVDRTLNVQSSAFQHEKYFKEIERVVNVIFNDYPLHEQPDYVVDMGCGNGSLLKSIYNIIRDKTLRGHCLVDHPIVLVGIDLNHKALEEASEVLKNAPHKLMHGDVSDPEIILETMGKYGIDDTSRMLHVRSFLDHNRTYYDQVETVGMNPWSLLPSESFGIGNGGELIPFSKMMQNLSMHLKRWSSILGDYGLLCLDVHSQTYWSKKEYSDTSEGFHFDALHAFSKQYLCEPEYFIAAMAENGLFSTRFFSGFPRNFNFTRITLGYYEKKQFIIRHIWEKELTDICSLNEMGNLSLVKEMANVLLSQEPELCFLIEPNASPPEAALFCNKGKYMGSGKYEAVVEAILCRNPMNIGFVEHLLAYAIQYMTLKYDISCLRGDVFGSIIPILTSLGAKPINDDCLKEGEVYFVSTED